MKDIIRLDGYSGYDVLLYRSDNRGPIVRKKARVASQNKRLKEQYKKHLFFMRQAAGVYLVPEVLNVSSGGPLFFYDYRYIEGVTLIHFIERSSAEEIRCVLDKLVDVMIHFARSPVYFESLNPSETFLRSIRNKIESNAEKCSLDIKIRNRLLRFLAGMPDPLVRTFCHGDLSFDNIIIDKERRLWLIDFLDLFYPHYWFDISKVFQDIDGKWYELKHNIRLPHNKLAYMHEYLLNRIREFDSCYETHHNFLLAIAFLRILPYAKSEDQKRIIQEKIRYFTKRL